MKKKTNKNSNNGKSVYSCCYLGSCCFCNTLIFPKVLRKFLLRLFRIISAGSASTFLLTRFTCLSLFLFYSYSLCLDIYSNVYVYVCVYICINYMYIVYIFFILFLIHFSFFLYIHIQCTPHVHKKVIWLWLCLSVCVVYWMKWNNNNTNKNNGNVLKNVCGAKNSDKTSCIMSSLSSPLWDLPWLWNSSQMSVLQDFKFIQYLASPIQLN